MSDGEGTSAPRRRITPSADVGPVDPNADLCLQRIPRTIFRPRSPPLAPPLACLPSIAHGSVRRLPFVFMLVFIRPGTVCLLTSLPLRLAYSCDGIAWFVIIS